MAEPNNETKTETKTTPKTVAKTTPKTTPKNKKSKRSTPSDKPQRNKLQRRMVALVVIAIIVFFAVVVGAALKFIGSNMMQEADIRYQTLTDNVQEEITTWFSNEAQIVLNQKAALEIMNDFSHEHLTEYLTRIVNDYNDEGYIYDLYFVNTANVMSSGYGYVPDPSVDFRTRPWYRDTIDNNGLFYSAPYKDSNLNKYVVTISTTCYGSNGNFEGVLALDIFVDTLFSIAEDKAIDGDSYVFLIDNNLGLATHPNSGFSYLSEKPIKLETAGDGLYHYIYEAIMSDNLDEEDGRLDNSIRDYDGVNRTFYVSKIPCCNWYVVSAVENNVFIRPLTNTLIVIILALAVCLIVGIIMSRVATATVISQLNEATDNAKLANETKGVFLANMSHEIRTPINAIIGMNEMVIRENTDPKINDYALDIASASRSLVTIVNDILDFSKIESGKMEIIENEFNIASVINDVINMSESRLGNKDLTLLYRIDPDIPVGILGDEMRIKQVILNMMTNAIKYTNTGFVLMRAEFTKQEYGINLDVFVKDSGIGISEENIGKLFQSFMRFDSKRNRSIEGTGLGLSITKRLITSMGGFIKVRSKSGLGSEFSFSIPLKVSDSRPFIEVENHSKYKLSCLFKLDTMEYSLRRETEKLLDHIRDDLKLDMTRYEAFEEFEATLKDESVTHIMIDNATYFEHEDFFRHLSEQKSLIVLQKRGNAVELPRNVVTFYTPLSTLSLAALLNNKKHSEISGRVELLTFKAPEAKILIVDDNAMNLKVAAGLMRPYGMKITTVDSGLKAIELLEQDRSYDIVFMDHMMPIMDGIEATAKIREMDDEYYKKLPVIALTANTINNAKRMFLEAGFDDFLAKPININLLDKVLRQYLPEGKIISDSEKAAGEALREEAATEQPAPAQPAAPAAPEPKQEKTFSPEEGLKYMGGSKELYLDILKEYVENSSEMKNFIENSFENKDWPNYVIKVHALKSTSLTIGAAPLSALSKELELSGKAGNIDPILEKTESLLKEYEIVLEQARAYLSENGITEVTEKNSAADESELNDSEKSLAAGYVAELSEAVSEFDQDKAEEIYERIKSEGQSLEQFFSGVMSLIGGFEFDEAEKELKELEKKL